MPSARRVAPLLLVAALTATVMACGGDDDGTTSAPARQDGLTAVTLPSPDRSKSPLEEAQAITDEFYDGHEEILAAMVELSGESEDDDRTFDVADECEGIHDPMTEQERGAMALYIGQVLIDNGSDVATFSRDLEEYRQDILATGVCG